jgi:hypothetical protein
MNQPMALGPAVLAAALCACAGLGCDSTGATPDCSLAADCIQEAGPSPIPDTGADGAGGQTQDAGHPDTAAGGADAGRSDAATPDAGQPDAADAAAADAGAG